MAIYFDMAGVEGGRTAFECALLGSRPGRLLFAGDYPQDFTGVNTDTGREMEELPAYIGADEAQPIAGPHFR